MQRVAYIDYMDGLASIQSVTGIPTFYQHTFLVVSFLRIFKAFIRSGNQISDREQW